MKKKYIRPFFIILIVVLTIVSINSENLFLFLSATIIYILLIITKIISIYKLWKEQKTSSITLITLNIIFFVCLGCFLLVMQELFILKGASKRGNYNSVHINDKEVARNGGVFKYDEYIIQLKEAALPFKQESDSIKIGNKYYEFFTIKHEPKNFTKKILIIASVHGDEPAGALSIPLFLKDIAVNPTQYQTTAICIVSPLNPVGLANTSRENGNGCNINRDFILKTQKETNYIIKVIDDFKPNLVLDIHENHGEFKTCLFANSMVPDSFGELICKDLSEKTIELENEPQGMSDNRLIPSGWSKQSTYERFLKNLIDYGDLRGYGNSINLPIIALECDESLQIEKRKSICVSAVKATINNIKQLK